MKAQGVVRSSKQLNRHRQLKSTLYTAAALLAVCVLAWWDSASAAVKTELMNPLDQYCAQFGYSVSAIPDVDGDDVGDIIVGAPSAGPGLCGRGPGRVYIYSGATAALLDSLISPHEQEYGWFGQSVSGMEDVDGDGFGDLVVGAPHEDPGDSPEYAGRAYIFSGATGALLDSLKSPHEGERGWFGNCVSNVPDVSGDGRPDVIVGAYGEARRYHTHGRAYIFNGATGALLDSLKSPNDPTPRSAWFGLSVSGVSDVNGDGFGDVVVGAPFEGWWDSPRRAGRAYIFSGATGALLDSLRSPTPEEDGYFGYGVSGIPDVDDDGAGDIVVGAPHEDPGSSPNEAGRVHVFSGARGGSSCLATLKSRNEQEEGWFGIFVSGMPDINGDGFGDIMVSAFHETPPGGVKEAGAVYMFSGANSADRAVLWSPNQEWEGHFGLGVSGLGDVDGDGYGDAIIGARSENRAGRAYLVTDIGLFFSLGLGRNSLVALTLGLVALASILIMRHRGVFPASRRGRL